MPPQRSIVRVLQEEIKTLRRERAEEVGALRREAAAVRAKCAKLERQAELLRAREGARGAEKSALKAALDAREHRWGFDAWCMWGGAGVGIGRQHTERGLAESRGAGVDHWLRYPAVSPELACVAVALQGSAGGDAIAGDGGDDAAGAPAVRGRAGQDAAGEGRAQGYPAEVRWPRCHSITRYAYGYVYSCSGAWEGFLSNYSGHEPIHWHHTLCSTLKRLEQVEEVISRQDASHAVMVEKLRAMEQEKERALNAAAGERPGGDMRLARGVGAQAKHLLLPRALRRC